MDLIGDHYFEDRTQPCINTLPKPLSENDQVRDGVPAEGGDCRPAPVGRLPDLRRRQAAALGLHADRRRGHVHRWVHGTVIIGCNIT